MNNKQPLDAARWTLDRMAEEDMQRGFRRGEMSIIASFTPPGCSALQSPADALKVPIVDWDLIAPARGKRPKGPITMPGIGQRKKKGKHKTKW